MGSGHDLVIVGTGGAAMAAAIAARGQAARVLLIEQGVVGGTCLNIGCVPSKTLLAAAEHRAAAASTAFPGAPTAAGSVDLAALVEQKDALVDQMRRSKYLAVAEAHGFQILGGTASFEDPDLLLVDGQPIPATAYLIATGAEPAMPDLPGMDVVKALTSTTAMELTVLPASLVIIGGGYVGMEQAQLFAGLGTTVTLVGRLAPHTEPEMADVMRAAFAEAGITVIERRATAVAQNGREITVTIAGGGQVLAERLLVATGRSPRTRDLTVAAAKIDLGARGFITVDARQRSSNPKVWAAGDVTGAPQYVYVAAATGKAAALNALGASTQVDYTALPAVTFTRPQIAGVGLGEQQAVDAGHDCACRTVTAADIPRALVNHDPHAALKIVADAKTGRVLGVHAAMEGAGEVIAAAGYALKAGLTVDDLADTWSPYLTMSEALRIAAGLFRTDKPVSCCA